MFTASRLLLWLGAMSLLGFGLMAFDKHRAKTGGWRVRERTLLLAGLLGGAAGGTLGMYLFRHKTSRPVFRLGLPLMLLLQIILCAHLLQM